MSGDKNSRLVWSDDLGGTVSTSPKGTAKTSSSPADGVVRVSRQTKGRKGKGVTLITGLPLKGSALKAFSKKLKQACGTGGTVKEDVVEIQGDQRERLLVELEKAGYTAKKAGG